MKTVNTFWGKLAATERLLRSEVIQVLPYLLKLRNDLAHYVHLPLRHVLSTSEQLARIKKEVAELETDLRHELLAYYR